MAAVVTSTVVVVTLTVVVTSKLCILPAECLVSRNARQYTT